GHSTNMFHINANLAELGHGDKCEVLRVGQVEKQSAFCKSASRRGLAVWAIDKFQLIRRAIQVLRKKQAQNSARGDEAIAMPSKTQGGRASMFFRGENLSQRSQCVGIGSEVRGPYVNVGDSQRAWVGRQRPKNVVGRH